MGWVSGAWKTVQEQGKPAAERVVRQFPKRFQEVRGTVASMSKKVHDSIESMDLEQKRTLLTELWRVRKSLDLMTLLNPDVLQALTGLDTSGLKSLIAQATHLSETVTSRIHGK